MSETKTDKVVRSLAMRSKLTNFPLIFETPDKLRTMSQNEKFVRKIAFDNCIAAEMRRQKSKFFQEQQKYIAQQLEENPVEIGGRTHSPTSSLEGKPTKSAHAETETADKATAVLREQRAASCRKSRMNNKLKKEALKHRNDFITAKLAVTQHTLASVTSKLQKAQLYLLRRGIDEAQIQNIRSIYGVGNITLD
ncbi:PREDICTED: protein sisterless A [Bactrocera latifrons]|uniref:Uncharacterized protein n=1 Tax=Bactrocera latifrons TaxID=174628 RepID=A0A0K8VV25_BACLA|nr:PREDICTED: protein sisterless A [Bactrocera latifrons]